MGRGRAQAVTQREWGRWVFEAVDERHRGRHGVDDNRWASGEVSDCRRVAFMELLEEFISVDVGGRFPAVMCLGETFPADKVLQLLPITSGSEYLIHFPLRLSFDKVRRRFLVFVAI